MQCDQHRQAYMFLTAVASSMLPLARRALMRLLYAAGPNTMPLLSASFRMSKASEDHKQEHT